MFIAAEEQPENPNLAFDRYDEDSDTWVQLSWSEMQSWDIWRYSMARHNADLCDVVPSQELLDRRKSYYLLT